jgi:cytoskeletal protein CcmA (bactofilin family)
MGKQNTKNLSIIDRELQVEGTISSKGSLVIKGTVTGTLVGESVVIAEEGVVRADASVISITIGGSFEGDIRASNELVILSTGKCSGKVVCKNIVVESGGILDAGVSCTVTDHLPPETKKLQETKNLPGKTDKSDEINLT